MDDSDAPAYAPTVTHLGAPNNPGPVTAP
jgi:hypothetical protein